MIPIGFDKKVVEQLFLVLEADRVLMAHHLLSKEYRVRSKMFLSQDGLTGKHTKYRKGTSANSLDQQVYCPKRLGQ